MTSPNMAHAETWMETLEARDAIERAIVAAAGNKLWRIRTKLETILGLVSETLIKLERVNEALKEPDEPADDGFQQPPLNTGEGDTPNYKQEGMQ